MQIICLLFLFNVVATFKTMPFSAVRTHRKVNLFAAKKDVAVDVEAESVKTMPAKPIILLDVDHVINMVGANSCLGSWNDTKSTVVNGFKIQYSPTVVDKINEWNKVADVRWLTTWNERAQKMLAPELKLDHFALARDPKLKWGKTQTAEKTAEEVGPDGLIIWIDDELSVWSEGRDMFTRISQIGVFEHRRNSVLVSPGDGLRPEHLAFIDKILENPGLPRRLTKCFEEECHCF